MTTIREPVELHDRVLNGVNAGDVEGLVELYEADGVLLGEDGSRAVGHDEIRAVYEFLVSFGGTLSLQTRFVVESDDIAMLSNQFTFSAPGFESTWITSEVARRQPDGTWKYVIDNPYVAPVDAPDPGNGGP